MVRLVQYAYSHSIPATYQKISLVKDGEGRKRGDGEGRREQGEGKGGKEGDGGGWKTRWGVLVVLRRLRVEEPFTDVMSLKVCLRGGGWRRAVVFGALRMFEHALRNRRSQHRTELSGCLKHVRQDQRELWDDVR